jgi:aerobic carbon-monoxide dehydrogenase large subunit
VQLGIGVSVYVEITAGGGRRRVRQGRAPADGTASPRPAPSPYGQGHDTAWAMLVADRLGIPWTDVTVVHGDTDLVPSGGGTGGSRSVQLGGSAIHERPARWSTRPASSPPTCSRPPADDVVLDTAERHLPRGRHPGACR